MCHMGYSQSIFSFNGFNWFQINTYFILQLSSILVSSGKIHDTHTVGQLIFNTVILVSKSQKKQLQNLGQESLLHKKKKKKREK